MASDVRERLLLATRSEGKLRELVPLLADAGFEAETLDAAGIPAAPEEDELEGFDTFEANALAKARWFAVRAPGRVVLADDSGLVVDALGGGPGVASKRWSNRPDLAGAELDEANNALLQRQLAEVPDDERSARFRCAAAAVWAGGELVETGETAGVITRLPQGAGGFGYDPYFFSADLEKSFGEATRAEKDGVSHRGRAFRALLERLGAR
jgi:XTP/dITP diphosphohydrolase